MQIHVYVSGDTTTLDNSILAFVPDGPTILLPAHPYSLPWRYLSTITELDSLFLAEGPARFSASRPSTLNNHSDGTARLRKEL